MHRPEMWGVIQFTSRPASESVSVLAIPGKPARDEALGVYYAERDFWAQHKRWGTNLTELAETGWSFGKLPPGVSAPILESTPDGYTCSTAFDERGRRRVWRIRQDRLLALDEPLPLESETFITQAAAQYGDAGRRAAYFLVDNMPAADRSTLSCDFLMENLSVAFEARQRFPWAQSLPERMFLRCTES